jgi:magnesium transporter
MPAMDEAARDSLRFDEGEDHIHRAEAPGAAPGTLAIDPDMPPPEMDVIAFDANDIIERRIKDPDEIDGYLDKWDMVWFNVDGVGDASVIRRIGEMFQLHRLTLEDVVHVHQRSKVEVFPNYVFIVARMVFLEEGLETEQLSILIGKNFILTFQEGRPGDCLEPVRKRLRGNVGKLRTAGPDFLAYALIDTVTDNYFPVLARYGDRIEELEDEVMAEEAYDDIILRVHEMKRAVLVLRRTLGPYRDAVQTLIRDPNTLIGEMTRTYLRDVQDHTNQLIELLDSYKEIATGLVDMHLSLASNRMNVIMNVLTVIGAVFMPLTFVTGLYGMNFDPKVSSLNMPELSSPIGYPMVLLIMVGMTVGMLLYFSKKGWLSFTKKRK